MKLRCVQCSHEVEKLYIQYSPGNIRLVKCANCKSVADEYIECELMILIIDLILHKPKAYRHLLFNLVQQKTPDLDGLLFKSSLVFLLLDAYRSWILNRDSQDWSVLSLGVNTLGLALLENVVSICALLVLSRTLLDFVEGFTGHKDVLLAMIASSYLKKQVSDMENQTETKPPGAAPTAVITSCRRKKKEDATFLEDLKDHIDEFISASVDEHKSCFTKTIHKMFGMSKAVVQKSSELQDIESILPLHTTISK